MHGADKGEDTEETIDPRAERQCFKDNVSMMDMKEGLIAVGCHTSDGDCQTNCDSHSEHTLCCLCTQLDYTHTHRLHTLTLSDYLHPSLARAPISSVPL